MAAIDQMKKGLKSLLTEIDGISAAIGENAPTEEQTKAYNSKIAQAKALKDSIEETERATEALTTIKSWANQSAGSAVSTSFGAALPTDGLIPGVTQSESGELYAYSLMGEDTLKMYKSGAYKDAFVDYLRSASRGTQVSQKSANIMSAVKSGAMKVLQEAGDTTGGAWLPPDFRAEVIKKIMTVTSVRRNAQVYTTGTDLITFPSVTWTTNDKYTTGATFGWQGAAALASATSESTNPVSGQIKIPINEAVAKFLMTRSQMEDNSFDLLGYLGEVMSETFGLGEEDYFTNGTGGNQPYGIITDATLQTNYVATGVSAALRWQGVVGSENPTYGLLGQEAALPPQYETGAKWYATKKNYAAIRGLVDSTYRPLWSQTDGGFSNWINGLPPTLLGYPIEKNQFLPDWGTASQYGSVVFGNLKGYYIVDRVGLSVEVFRETYADYGQVLIYGRKRMGGQVVKPWMIKINKEAAS